MTYRRRTLFTPGRSWFNLFDMIAGVALDIMDRRAARRRP